jgi:hypothetical protein
MFGCWFSSQLTIEDADQHILVLGLPMDAPILPGSQGLVKVAVGIISDQVCDREKKGGAGRARRDRSGGPQ